MNILDENIPEDQRQLLRSWRIRFRQLGFEVGHPGMADDQIIPLLHRLGRCTFFTRDLGFYIPHLRHVRYGLVCLAVSQYEATSFIRRFLGHPEFTTQAMRLGKVVQVKPSGITSWRLQLDHEEEVAWPSR
jgi:hypothetical protein